jgi:hypothetical protein
LHPRRADRKTGEQDKSAPKIPTDGEPVRRAEDEPHRDDGREHNDSAANDRSGYWPVDRDTVTAVRHKSESW